MQTGWLAFLMYSMQVNVRPKIVTGPRNVAAPLGQKLLELECGIQAASGDDPEVVWWKDGAELGEFGFQNEKFGLQNEKRMRLARNNNSLLIYNISSTDQGWSSLRFTLIFYNYFVKELC